jgi:hypothetical protein
MDENMEDDNEEDLSRVATRKKEYLKWVETVEKALQYAREEVEQGGESFRRLFPPSISGLKRLITLVENAYILDHGRKRRKTWSSKRAGANQFRN